MNFSLTVVGGVHHGKMIPMMANEFRIGRDPSCHLKPAAEEVARRHCSFLVHPTGKVFLKDTSGMTSGTIVNRRCLINGELQMEDGDVVQVGPLIFRVNLQAFPVSGATTPTVPSISLSMTETKPAIELPELPKRGPMRLPGISSVMNNITYGTITHPREESALENCSLSESNIFNFSRQQDLVDLLIESGSHEIPNVHKIRDAGSKLCD